MCTCYQHVFVHHLTFLRLAECVRNCFTTLSNIHASNAQEAQKFPDSCLLPPAAQKRLEEIELTQSRFSHTFVPGMNLKATITSNSDGKSFESDISKYTQGEISCTCGQPLISGLPCEHNKFHAEQCQLSVAQIVNSKLTTAGWKASYEAATAVGGFGEVRSPYA